MFTGTTTSSLIGTSLFLFAQSKEATHSLVKELSNDVTRIIYVDSPFQTLPETDVGPGCLIVTAADASHLDFAALKRSLPAYISIALRGPVADDVLLKFIRAGYASHSTEHVEFVEMARQELNDAVARWDEMRIQAEFARQLANLTDREQQVYELVVHGLETKAIAGSLGIAVGTAEKHKLSMLRKLSCKSPTELLANLLVFTKSPALMATVCGQ